MEQAKKADRNEVEKIKGGKKMNKKNGGKGNSQV